VTDVPTQAPQGGHTQGSGGVPGPDSTESASAVSSQEAMGSPQRVPRGRWTAASSRRCTSRCSLPAHRGGSPGRRPRARRPLPLPAPLGLRAPLCPRPGRRSGGAGAGGTGEGRGRDRGRCSGAGDDPEPSDFAPTLSSRRFASPMRRGAPLPQRSSQGGIPETSALVCRGTHSGELTPSCLAGA